MAEPKPKDKQHQNDKTPFKRFENLTEKLLKVPKGEVDKKRAEQEKARKRKQN